MNRLRASRPFPNEENLKKTRAQNEVYRTSLLALENELKTRMFPRLPLQPNEFQAQLRHAVTAIQEKATASKVQLPPNFNLGFDEYATSLPNGQAAPRLGRQLRAIEWIANTIIEAHVDALTSLTRSPLPEEKAAPTPNPRMTASAPKKRSKREDCRIDFGQPGFFRHPGSDPTNPEPACRGQGTVLCAANSGGEEPGR